MEQIRVLLANVDKPNSTAIHTYPASGGYESARKALAMQPGAITQIVKDTELRGRGGAGAATGMKWSLVPEHAPKPAWLPCNADESEPGRFDDGLLTGQ